MGVLLQVVLVVLALLLAHLLSVTEPSFSPVAAPWDPIDERVVRALHHATSIPAVCKVLDPHVHGAEDFAFDGDWAYTGLHNGTIIRFNVEDAARHVFRSEVVVETGSRPLGLRFCPVTGHLFFADAHRGLMEFNRGTRQLVVRAHSAAGTRFLFADHIAIARDGSAVYLSDASTKYSLNGTGVMDDFFEGRPYGRLVKVDTRTWQATVLATGLYFANGVVLSADERTLIFSETAAARLSVLDLHTLRVSRLLSKHVSDNLSPSATPGHFWAAVVTKRGALTDAIAGSALLRRLLRKLPAPTARYSAGLLLNERGDVLRAFEDPQGELLSSTSVYASYRDRLYIGSFKERGIVTCPL